MTAGTEAGLAAIDVVRCFLEHPSEAAFEAVFRIFAPRMLRFFELRGCGRALAEDLTQDTMLGVYRQCGALRDASKFRAWVYGIGRNLHLMHLRREGWHAQQVALEAVSETLQAVSPDALSNSVLYESLARLDEMSRHILVLRYLDGLEYHEIAEFLEMPLGTVQWRVFDAKKRMARSMSATCVNQRA